MPKILRIINRFNLGGPTYNVAYLTKHLAPEFETVLIGGEKDEQEESSLHILEGMDLQVELIPEMRRAISWQDDWHAFKKLRSIIRKHKPDIVHTHASKAGTLGRLAAWMEGVPVIVHTFHGHVFHSYFGSFKTAAYKWIERFLALLSTRIIAISQGQKEELCRVHRIASERKAVVIPLGFDLKKFSENQESKRVQFREKWGLQPQEVAIGIIGRLVPIKNHEFLLEAIAKLKSETTAPFRLLIVGDGELRQSLEMRCLDLGLSISSESKPGEVIFTSWITEVDKVVAGIDIAVLTSLNEGTPVSLIEAQAGGLPVVSTKVGGIHHVVLEDITGFLLEKGDLNTLIRHLKILVESPTLRKEMGEKGKLYVEKQFHYTRLVEETRHLYRQLLTGKNGKNKLSP